MAQDILQWSIENRDDIMRETNRSLWRCFTMPDYIKIVKSDDRIVRENGDDIEWD